MACEKVVQSSRGQHRAGGNTHLIEDVLQALLSECRAFDVLDCSEFAGKPLTLLGGNWPLLLSLQFLEHLRVVSQIDLSTDDEARHSRTVMVDLWEPLLLHVLKGGRRSHAEAHEEDVRLGV